MKKLLKKELEIIVAEVSNEICKVKKEKLVKKFEDSEEGKRMKELEGLINEQLSGINVYLKELREKKEKFEDRELKGIVGWGLLRLEVENSVFKDWEVKVRVGEDYDNRISSEWGIVRKEVERELVLEGLKGEFDLDKLVKGMIKKLG